MLEALWKAAAGVQGLVTLFIVVSGIGLGVTAYFALTASIIESGLFALIAILAGVLFQERRLRLRAEARMEKAVDDLARLLSTDAKAGQVLSQRVNALSDLDLGPRIEVIEADISVLGTVVRQVAEAVSELETAQGAASPPPPEAAPQPAAVVAAPPPEPRIPLAEVTRALDNARLVHYMQAIVTLPQRRPHGYDLVPRLLREDGEMVDTPDFLPSRSAQGDAVIRRIERQAAEEAVTIVRRARVLGAPVRLFFSVSRATLADRGAGERLAALLAVNQVAVPELFLSIPAADWQRLDKAEAETLAGIVESGVGLALRDLGSFRLDFAALAARGVRYVSADATRFLSDPAQFTDFHAADIADYTRRFGIQLVITGIVSEEQILTLLDDGIGLAQGPAIAAPAPIRHDLRADEAPRAARRPA